MLLGEGRCETMLLERCLDEGLLVFTRKDLLDQRPIHARQITPEIIVLLNTLKRGEQVVIYRVGDTQKDELDLKAVSERVFSVRTFCTKPEIEILIIINEGLLKEYSNLSASHRLMPKEFVRSRIRDYDFETALNRVQDIGGLLKEYRRVKKHRSKKEEYLADLLR